MAQAGAAQAPWVDHKRYLWLLGPGVPVIGLVALGLFQEMHWHWVVWMPMLIVHGALPLLDWIVGEDRENPPDSAIAALESDPYYRWLLFAFVPLQLAVTLWGAWLFVNVDVPWYHLLGLGLSVGLVSGIAINTGHELGHKKNTLDQWLARIALAPSWYGHFYVEHNRGHHKNVATPEDPASSRMGETFWAFLPRTVMGSLKSAWHLEAERLGKQGRSAWSMHNQNLQSWAISLALFAAVVAWLGWAALPFLIIQAVYGFSLLEVVNYLEHYGLLRQKGADGRYERCQPRHSWNSNHIVTNLFLYHLQRHSDHHAFPARRFQALRHFDEGPQLPSGYAAMLMVAYIPPLWFALMDKKVLNHYNGDITQANIHPSKRKALLARYGKEKARTMARA